MCKRHYAESIILLLSLFVLACCPMPVTSKNLVGIKDGADNHNDYDDKLDPIKPPPATCKPLPVAKGIGKDEFTIVLLPDTQKYTYSESGDLDIYKQQAIWIREHKDQYNIKHVIHLGDITDKNKRNQWEIAQKAHKIIDKAGILQSLVPGNHDYKAKASNTDTYVAYRDKSRFITYFGEEQFIKNPLYSDIYFSMDEQGENSYILLKINNLQFMVMSLEFAPRDSVLEWANREISKHKDYRTIIATHCYIKENGKFSDCEYGDNIKGNGGKNLWKNLAKKHENVFLVVSGHVNGSRLVKNKRKGMNTVFELLTDYQKEIPGNCAGGKPAKIIGGMGWLRTLHFVPRKNKIYVQSHSVIGSCCFNCDENKAGTDGSPNNSAQCFSITYDM